jgi:hypothetical protein
MNSLTVKIDMTCYLTTFNTYRVPADDHIGPSRQGRFLHAALVRIFSDLSGFLAVPQFERHKNLLEGCTARCSHLLSSD